MLLRPLADKIVVRPEKAPEKIGSLYVPDAAQEKPVRGEVLAVGPGRTLKDGAIRPCAIKAGEVVLFGKYAGNEVKIEGEELMILREDDILGIIAPAKK